MACSYRATDGQSSESQTFVKKDEPLTNCNFITLKKKNVIWDGVAEESQEVQLLKTTNM